MLSWISHYYIALARTMILLFTNIKMTFQYVTYVFNGKIDSVSPHNIF